MPIGTSFKLHALTTRYLRTSNHPAEDLLDGFLLHYTVLQMASGLTVLGILYKKYYLMIGPDCKWPISETIMCIVKMSFGGQLNAKKR